MYNLFMENDPTLLDMHQSDFRRCRRNVHCLKIYEADSGRPSYVRTKFLQAVNLQASSSRKLRTLARVTEKTRFIDQGQNWEQVTCPRCGTSLLILVESAMISMNLIC